MKTSGATRKKPSHRKPGSPQASVIRPLRPPRAPPDASPSAFSACCGRCASSASASSTSCNAAREASLPGCSGVEELDILLLPVDPDCLALLAAQRGVALARHLREHALSRHREVEFHEVAEELDEDDLA